MIRRFVCSFTLKVSTITQPMLHTQHITHTHLYICVYDDRSLWIRKKNLVCAIESMWLRFRPFTVYIGARELLSPSLTSQHTHRRNHFKRSYSAYATLCDVWRHQSFMKNSNSHEWNRFKCLTHHDFQAQRTPFFPMICTLIKSTFVFPFVKLTVDVSLRYNLYHTK